MAKSSGDSTFAQRLWRRHTQFSTFAPHTRLMRRIYRMHGDRLPLLHTLQRRWSPATAASSPTRAALPYVQPPVFTGGPRLAPATVPRMPSASANMPRSAKPVVTVQRAASLAAGDANPGATFAQRRLVAPHAPLVQRQAAIATVVPGRSSFVALKAKPGNSTPAAPTGSSDAATNLPFLPASVAPPLVRGRSDAGAVQRVTATTPPAVVQRAAALGDVRSTSPRMPEPRATNMSAHSISAVPTSQLSVTAPSPVVQRQSVGGHAGRQLPFTGVDPNITGLMRRAAPVASAVAPPVLHRLARNVMARQTGAASVAPMTTPAVALAPAPSVVPMPGATSAVVAGRRRVLPLSIQRFRQAPLTSALVNRARQTRPGPAPSNPLSLMPAPVPPRRQFSVAGGEWRARPRTICVATSDQWSHAVAAGDAGRQRARHRAAKAVDSNACCGHSPRNRHVVGCRSSYASRVGAGKRPSQPKSAGCVGRPGMAQVDPPARGGR